MTSGTGNANLVLCLIFQQYAENVDNLSLFYTYSKYSVKIFILEEILKPILKPTDVVWGQVLKGKSVTQGGTMLSVASAKSAFLIGYMAITAINAIAVHGENYYKWVDRHGVTHYSETQPGDISASIIQVKPGNASTDNPAIQAVTGVTASSKQSTLLAPPQQNAQQLAIQRSNCSKAGRKLIALENAGRVRQLDDQTGEYRYLPNQEKLAEISRLRGYLKTYCRGK